MRPDTKMHIVKGRQDTPHAVDLGEVPVDLGHNQEYRRDEKREGETSNQWVGAQVDGLQCFEVIVVGNNLVGQFAQLGNERANGAGEV